MTTNIHFERTTPKTKTNKKYERTVFFSLCSWTTQTCTINYKYLSIPELPFYDYYYNCIFLAFWIETLNETKITSHRTIEFIWNLYIIFYAKEIPLFRFYVCIKSMIWMDACTEYYVQNATHIKRHPLHYFCF